MKNYSIILLLIIFSSCASIIKDGEQQDLYIQPDKLKKDVDFAYSKLQQMHPHLYWYIPKKELDYKFDSLKQTLTQPLTSLQFYFRFQPVIAGIREGHLSLRIPRKIFTKKEIKSLENQKGMFSRFEYYISGNQMYIIQNRDSIENIQPGTEILSINGIPVSDYIKKYRSLISSDGDNTTFYSYFLKDHFFNFYTAEYGFASKASIETLYKGEKKTYNLIREIKSDIDHIKEKEMLKKTQEKKLNNYIAASDSYNRNFKFLDKDSSIAYIKIKSFSKEYSDKFYKKTFTRIHNAKSPYLIIDIRNNYGGSLYEINNLYSYLVDAPFTLIKPSQVTSWDTPLRTNYFRKSSPLDYALKSISYPSYFLVQTFSTYKKDNKVFYKIKVDKPTQPKKVAFHGKLYVLIN